MLESEKERGDRKEHNKRAATEAQVVISRELEKTFRISGPGLLANLPHGIEDFVITLALFTPCAA